MLFMLPRSCWEFVTPNILQDCGQRSLIEVATVAEPSPGSALDSLGAADTDEALSRLIMAAACTHIKTQLIPSSEGQGSLF